MRVPHGFIWCTHCARPHELAARVCPETGRTIERALHRKHHDHELIGAMIDGRYRVLRVIGHGGVGIVFECENVLLRRPVALKIVSNLTHESAFERLRREAQILASLQHPNVCDIYDVGAIRHYGPYLVTERLHGETISARLRWDLLALTIARDPRRGSSRFGGPSIAHEWAS